MYRKPMRKPTHLRPGRERATKVISKMRIPMRCRKLETRLEEYLEGISDFEVDEHLTHCADCRATEDSRLAGDLLRRAGSGASEPRQVFLVGGLGENSGATIARRTTGGVLEPDRISGIPVDHDSRHAIACPVRISCGVCAATADAAAPVESHRTAGHRFSGAARRSGKQR
jgi:hypothetical protein